jgi:anaphase-promoting complex subunit 10
LKLAEPIIQPQPVATPGGTPTATPPNTLAEGWKFGYYITDTLEEEEVAGRGGGGEEKEEEDGLQTLNDQAVWHISGARPGNGVDCLLDTSLETFWQSDGVSPHMVYVQFLKRTTVAEICIYVDYKIDESYTPKKLSIRAGTTHHDLEEIRVLHLDKPSGWVRIPVGNPLGKGINRYLRTWYIQVIIYFMHQNGRDTHVRCMKVLGPRSIGTTISTRSNYMPSIKNEKDILEDEEKQEVRNYRTTSSRVRLPSELFTDTMAITGQIR